MLLSKAIYNHSFTQPHINGGVNHAGVLLDTPSEFQSTRSTSGATAFYTKLRTVDSDTGYEGNITSQKPVPWYGG